MEQRISSLSVVLPCFNEELVIQETLEKSISYLRRLSFPFEVIVVNDGSLDRTCEILEELRGLYPEMLLVHHAKNRGYGQAIASGFNAARNEWLFLMDADGQFDIRELDSLLPFASGYDMVLGYRASRADPWHRVLFTRWYQWTLRGCMGLRLRDVGCAFKLFSRKSWRASQPIHSRDHKIFIAEWLYKSIQNRCRYQEVAVSHYPRLRGRATGARLDVIGVTLKALVSLVWRERIKRSFRGHLLFQEERGREV